MNHELRTVNGEFSDVSGTVKTDELQDDGTFGQAESFEGETVPILWQATGGGDLQLSRAHYKHGRQCLRWQWAQGSALTVTRPPYLDEAGGSRNGGMKLWIYNESPVDGKLSFRFGSEREMDDRGPRYAFEIGINFTGWRGFNVHFREDGMIERSQQENKGAAAGRTANEDEQLEVMEIVPPEGAASGSIFFDAIEFVEHVPASRSSDDQMPFTRQRTNGGKGGSWDRSFHFSRQRPQLPLDDAVTPEQLQAFETIARRSEEWVYGVRPDVTREPIRIRYEALQSFIRSGLNKFESLRLRRDENGCMTGMPLFSSRSAHGPEFGKSVSRTIFLPLVLDYKMNGNPESKRKALDLFDHFHDQGWAAGSGLETLDHETNRNSGYFHAVFLMRKELRETGRLERELAAMNWFTNFGKTYGMPGVDYMETTSDEVRTRFHYKLLYVLAMDDTPEKVRRMKGLLQWMNHALAIAPGYAGTIKHDYMGFHHRGVYMSAYAPNAYHTAALIAYLLHGTPFALSPSSVHNVKQALLTLRTVTNKYDVPVGISGRFPTKGGITNEMLPAYAYMALAGDPVDPDMAGAFMRLWDDESPYLKEKLFPLADSKNVQYTDTIGGLQLMLGLADEGYSPERSPQGYWFKPSAALAVLRRDDWMVSTKGWSQYVFDFEVHGRRNAESAFKVTEGENVYGRYVSYGAMQILASGDPVSAEDSGYALDQGWDWCRWPGATTKRLALEAMEVGKGGSKNGMFNENTRSFSDETFVGGVVSEGTDGVFAMKLHDTVFDPSFRAVKSYFYFGREVIALGSHIQSDDGVHRTETTLFQSHMPDTSMPIVVNSAETTAFPYSFHPAETGPVWIIDPYGNGYVVPDPQGLHLERGMQHSMDHSGGKPTSGAYSTAWIDHGTKPDGAGYEYAVLVQVAPEEVETYAKTPPYRVLRKDEQAHVVEHRGERAIGYALFDPGAHLSYGILRSASVPVLAMEKERGGELVLSVSDPDLRLPKLPNQKMEDHIAWTAGTASQVRIELAGRWELRTDRPNPSIRSIQSDAQSTILELECANGVTVEVTLTRAN
ncbi:chondroitinase family polysaccharide lyase [Paenibacillus allorhizosphaerae]|uniref:Chondroitin sulfate ABC exolyase n=1 Tax=Paenibacillus allorhizosphaerae TaxID=2849866 RepID=A0ABN7TGF9_9BACL|nr:chondroitinase family polysaccharide lyase [Paenibacillus allorhizosphaerae]CAG7619224.1 Chondroitin sulfate ABC exolyase [Paenibacillus allorhizosphaerae]